MAKVNLQLGKLDFDSIKQSIIDHLKTQDTLKDYDYEGSAAQVLLDILAYNTLYYAYYSNMVASEMFLDTAQKEESVISLVKPLGYVVPGKTSARGRGKVRGWNSNAVLPAYTRFTGRNARGVQYNLYTIQSYDTDNDGETVVTLVEGKSLVNKMPLMIDGKTQKGFLSGLDVDISTLKLEVYDSSPEGGIEGAPAIGWKEWDLAGNIESNLASDSRVYWLERSELGFFVIFGGNLTNTIGQDISPNDKVRVTYLKSSGSLGNEVAEFQIQDGSGASVEVMTGGITIGGTDKPDIEAIRFFAPKWFASQDRAVTVEDCRAILAREGFVSGDQDPYSRFNVWGGEEMTPPRYGRVFVSLDVPNEDDPASATTARQILEQKTCVSIIPEFINPEEFQVKMAGNVYFRPELTRLDSNGLRNLILDNLDSEYQPRFEQEYSLSTIVNLINSLDESLRANVENIDMMIRTKIKVNVDDSVVPKYFNNKVQFGTLTSDEIVPSLEIADSIDSETIQLRSSGKLDRRGNETLEAYYFSGGINNIVSADAGYMTEDGEVRLRPNIFGDDFHIEVQPLLTEGSPSFYVGQQQYAGTLGMDFNITRVGIN